MKFENLELMDKICLMNMPFLPVTVRGIDKVEKTLKTCVRGEDGEWYCRTMSKTDFEKLDYVKMEWLETWDEDVPISWVDKECPDCHEQLVECELPGCRGGYCCLNCDYTIPDGEY